MTAVRRPSSLWRSVVAALLLFPALLLAAAKEAPIEFFASSLDSNLSGVRAKGNVLVLYGSYYLSADEAVFDRNSSTLELFGNIVAMQGSDYFAMGDYARLDAQTRTRMFAPFFMLDRVTDVWMSSLRAGAKEQDFTITKGMVSGCDPSDPLWVLYFSSADYNSETRWMNVYNAYLELYGVPLFYFPYFGYSLDFRRRSGLLIPSFGVSSTEGFYYEQPIYIAIDPSWDLELRPQIRTERGEGMYGELRFVDSPYSSGKLHTGYFKEHNTYVQTYQLANDRHYGFDFDYANTALLQDWFGLDLSGQSGLYVDAGWMNDIDYVNLSTNDVVQLSTANQVLSRVNLFYNEEDAYYGVNLRYYQDLTQKSNAETIQNLPTLRYHRYMHTFLEEHLYYSFDAQSNNYFRQRGENAVETVGELPVTLQTALLDDYLQLAYSAQFSGKYITFSGESLSTLSAGAAYNSGWFGRIYHQVSAGTQVSKPVGEYAHTVGLKATYTKAGVDLKDGYYEEMETLCSGDSSLEGCEFYSINEIEEEADIRFEQYFTNARGDEVLSHRMIQNISFDPLNDQLSELENELTWRPLRAIELYSDLFYNYQAHRVTKMLNAARYRDESLEATLSDLYEDTDASQGSARLEHYLRMGLAYRYNEHYRYTGKYAFDMQNHVKKYAEIGFLYSKRCWEFGMRYVENNRPILTENDASSVFEKYVYFTIMFKPMGGTEVNYKLSNVLDGS